MKVLFKSFHGSKLYGTNTPTSDTDYKVIYLPSVRDVLLGKRFPNFKDTTASDAVRNGPDDVETEFIALQTFAKDFYEGQTYALELAFAQNIEPENELTRMFSSFCNVLRQEFLTADVSKMIGFAYHQASVYSVKGARLDILKKFYDHVRGMTVSINDKCEILIPWVQENANEYLFNTTVENARGGMLPAPAISILGKLITCSAPFYVAVDMLEKMVDRYGDRAKKAMEDKGYDWKAISHALRVTMEAVDLLETGSLMFPYDDITVDYLKNIKNGEFPWVDVDYNFQRLLELVDEAKKTTTLPFRNPELDEKFNNFLYFWLSNNFYEVYENL